MSPVRACERLSSQNVYKGGHFETAVHASMPTQLAASLFIIGASPNLMRYGHYGISLLTTSVIVANTDLAWAAQSDLIERTTVDPRRHEISQPGVAHADTRTGERTDSIAFVVTTTRPSTFDDQCRSHLFPIQNTIAYVTHLYNIDSERR
jgi:hypothetical protein